MIIRKMYVDNVLIIMRLASMFYFLFLVLFTNVLVFHICIEVHGTRD
jgi:hypothetical protein